METACYQNFEVVSRFLKNFFTLKITTILCDKSVLCCGQKTLILREMMTSVARINPEQPKFSAAKQWILNFSQICCRVSIRRRLFTGVNLV